MSDHGLKATLLDTALLLVVRTLPVAVQLGVSLAILRFAGPKPYVSYTLHLSVVLAFASVTSAWLAQGLMRNQDLLRDSSQTFALIILGSALTMTMTLPVIWLGVWILLGDDTFGFAVVAGLYVSTFLYLVRLHATIGRSQPLLALLTECLRSLILIIGSALVLAAAGDRQAEHMLWISAASFGVAAYVGSSPKPQKIDLVCALRSLRAVFNGNALSCAWMAFALALFLVDRLALTDAVSPAMLAAYIFTADVTQRAAQFLFSPLGLVVQPRIAIATKAKGIAAGYAAVQLPLVYQLVGTLVVGAFGVVFWAYGLERALGPAMVPAHSVLLPLMGAALLWQAATLWQKPLEFGGFLASTTLSLACAAGIQTVIVLMCGGTYGVAAAAWGLLAAVAFYWAMLLLIAWRAIGRGHE